MWRFKLVVHTLVFFVKKKKNENGTKQNETKKRAIIRTREIMYLDFTKPRRPALPVIDKFKSDIFQDRGQNAQS